MERDESSQKFEEYLKRKYPDRRTPKDYVSDLRKFMGVCSKPWREVNKYDIDTFVDQQQKDGLKPATVKRRSAALKTFFDFLAEESDDYSWVNPVRMKRHGGKQEQRLPRDLSDEAVEKLWVVISRLRDRAWFALMLRAGLRVGEVVSLKLEDILRPAREKEPARLRAYGKGRKERLVLLTGDAYAVLQAWLQERPKSEHPHVFLNERDGEPLSESGIEYCLRQYGQQADVPVTPHQLRHTYARQLTEAGMPIASLSKLMGHAQVSTTQIYTEGADPELAQAYQQAMERLSNATLPAAEENYPAPTVASTTLEPIQRRVTPEPDWDDWDAQLPVGIREATIAFVKHRMPTWRPHKQHARAKVILGEFHRFWQGQFSLRPIQHPGELTLRDLHAFQVQGALGKATPRTVDYTIGMVISLLKELADQGVVVDHSVFRFKPRKRPQSLPRHLAEAEAQMLEKFVAERLNSQDEQIRLENACYFVLAHTGLRASECLDLCMQDLDLPGRRLWVRLGKGKRDRVVYLSDTACQALRIYLGTSTRPSNAFLFTKLNGQPMSYFWLYQHLIDLAKTVGIHQLTPHRLRHTLATRLLNSGMEITRIQKLLGHNHVNTTLIYARVHDQTVEANYRRSMLQIELYQLPLSNTPVAVDDWLKESKTSISVSETLDNSV